MLRKLCLFASRHLPSFTISKDGLKYLSRFYFFLKDRQYFNIYLHQFHRSDMDIGANGLGLLHNHPVPFAIGIPLINGYWEERRNVDDSITKKFVKPFSLNFLSYKDFHRVDLVGEDAWTIFITGPRIKGLDWYFWDRTTKEVIPWQNIAGAIE